MSKTDAAYMRAYRARKRAEAEVNPTAVVGSFTGQVAALRKELARVEDERDGLFNEVRHLKEELAKRPTVTVEATTSISGEPVKYTTRTFEPGYSTRPFTPVPKKGK